MINSKLTTKNLAGVMYWGYELENGEFLIDEEFNGEVYHSSKTGKYYRPEYKKIDEDEYEVIGFNEEF